MNRVFSWLRNILSIRNDDFVSVEAVRQADSGTTKVGQGLDSNVVMAPIQWIMRTFTQAAPIVERKRSGRWSPVDDHPAERLLLEPNEFYDGDALMKALLVSFFLDGNAYLMKVRSPLRRVVELWYVPHWLIEAKWPQDGSTFISHYDYRPTGGLATPVDTQDVVHLRFGLEPRNPRLGMSPIKAALREVLTDEEASAFSSYILQNMGVPGGVISPADGALLPSDSDVQEMKDHMQGQFSGKNRGKWLVVGAPTNIAQFGFDPNRLQLGPLRDISEERVCAMLGVPAAVVGFGAGLQQTKVGATMRELVRLARVNCVEPTQMSIGRQFSRQILPEFEANPHRSRIVFDNAHVSMFQEDLTNLAERAVLLFKGGIVRKGRAQEMVGEEPGEDADEYYHRSIRPPTPTATA